MCFRGSFSDKAVCVCALFRGGLLPRVVGMRPSSGGGGGGGGGGGSAGCVGHTAGAGCTGCGKWCTGRQAHAKVFAQRLCMVMGAAVLKQST